MTHDALSTTSSGNLLCLHQTQHTEPSWWLYMQQMKARYRYIHNICCIRNVTIYFEKVKGKAERKSTILFLILFYLQVPACVAASPEGFVRFWPSIAHEGSYFEVSTELQVIKEQVKKEKIGYKVLHLCIINLSYFLFMPNTFFVTTSRIIFLNRVKSVTAWCSWDHPQGVCWPQPHPPPCLSSQAKAQVETRPLM